MGGQSVEDLERVIAAMRRVVERLQGENEQLKKSVGAGGPQYVDALKENKRLKVWYTISCSVPFRLQKYSCITGLQNRRFWWVTDKFIQSAQPPFWFVRTEGIGTRENGGGGRGQGRRIFPPPPPPPFPQFASVPHPGSLCSTHPRLSRFSNKDGGRDSSAWSLIRLLCRLWYYNLMLKDVL